MSEQIIEQHDDTTAKDRYECPDCGETFKLAMHLGSHRKAKHGYTAPGGKRKRTSPGSTARPRSDIARIRSNLGDAAKGMAVIPISLRNPHLLADQRVVNVVEHHSDAFAAAWTGVAEVDPRVKKWLLGLMTGSVWANAAGASLGFVYAVAVFSGYAPLHPAVALIPGMGDLAPFVAASSPPPATPTNGDGPHE